MTQIAVFDAHPFERPHLMEANEKHLFDLNFIEPRLTEETAILAQGASVVCSFANDRLNRATLTSLFKLGVKLIALRSAGFNHVDLKAAEELGIPVVRVPKYSPYAVAEHAIALLLTLNRKIHRAYVRVRELNFSLDGLVGFDLNGKTVGVIGTGKIGSVVVKILNGFGCRVLGYDIATNPDIPKDSIQYVSLDALLSQSDIITLHVPLNPKTRHLIDESAFQKMKKEAILINTGRGALIDSKALVSALKSQKVGGAALDVYEEEEGVFFKDLSEQGLKDDLLARLLTFPNVLMTSHQGFLTHEALRNIATTTFQNIQDFVDEKPLVNQVK